MKSQSHVLNVIIPETINDQNSLIFSQQDYLDVTFGSGMELVGGDVYFIIATIFSDPECQLGTFAQIHQRLVQTAVDPVIVDTAIILDSDDIPVGEVRLSRKLFKELFKDIIMSVGQQTQLPINDAIDTIITTKHPQLIMSRLPITVDER